MYIENFDLQSLKSSGGNGWVLGTTRSARESFIVRMEGRQAEQTYTKVRGPVPAGITV